MFLRAPRPGDNKRAFRLTVGEPLPDHFRGRFGGSERPNRPRCALAFSGVTEVNPLGASAAAEELPCAFGSALLRSAGAALGHRHAGQHLIDVPAAAGVGDLSAGVANRALTHGTYLSQEFPWVLQTRPPIYPPG